MPLNLQPALRPLAHGIKDNARLLNAIKTELLMSVPVVKRQSVANALVQLKSVFSV